MTHTEEDRMSKRTASLPPLRVEDEVLTALMHLAASEDRTLAEYVRRALVIRHVLAHLPSLVGPDDMHKLLRALQRDASPARRGSTTGAVPTVFGGLGD